MSNFEKWNKEEGISSNKTIIELCKTLWKKFFSLTGNSNNSDKQITTITWIKNSNVKVVNNNRSSTKVSWIDDSNVHITGSKEDVTVENCKMKGCCCC